MNPKWHMELNKYKYLKIFFELYFKTLRAILWRSFRTDMFPFRSYSCVSVSFVQLCFRFVQLYVFKLIGLLLPGIYLNISFLENVSQM